MSKNAQAGGSRGNTERTRGPGRPKKSDAKLLKSLRLSPAAWVQLEAAAAARGSTLVDAAEEAFGQLYRQVVTPEFRASEPGTQD